MRCLPGVVMVVRRGGTRTGRGCVVKVRVIRIPRTPQPLEVASLCAGEATASAAEALSLFGTVTAASAAEIHVIATLAEHTNHPVAALTRCDQQLAAGALWVCGGTAHGKSLLISGGRNTATAPLARRCELLRRRGMADFACRSDFASHADN